MFDAEVGSPQSGEVLVRVRRLGLNAGLAHRIGGTGTAYGPGIGVGDVPASDAVLEIIESNDPAFHRGDLAVGKSPWRTESVLDASGLRTIPTPKSDNELTAYLTILGHVGFTAYTGMIQIGAPPEASAVVRPNSPRPEGRGSSGSQGRRTRSRC